MCTWMLLYLPGASGLGFYSSSGRALMRRAQSPPSPELQPVCLGKELVQHNKQITWTAKLKSLTVFMQQSPSPMLAIPWVMGLWTFLFSVPLLQQFKQIWSLIYKFRVRQTCNGWSSHNFSLTCHLLTCLISFLNFAECVSLPTAAAELSTPQKATPISYFCIFPPEYTQGCLYCCRVLPGYNFMQGFLFFFLLSAFLLHLTSQTEAVCAFVHAQV